jgi:hypothetical protein
LKNELSVDALSAGCNLLALNRPSFVRIAFPYVGRACPHAGRLELLVRGDSVMNHHLKVMLALAVCTVNAHFAQSALAQYHQAQTGPRRTGATVPNGRAVQPQQQYVESLPHGHTGPSEAMMYGSPHNGSYIEHDFGHGGYPSDGSWNDGCSNGYSGPSYSFDDGCCNSCGGYGCDGDCWHRGGLGTNLFGAVCPPGRYFITADYLYVRANFSEATAFLDQTDDTVQGLGTDEFHELDFKYESSYRFGGGYRTCNCNEEVRFMFTRLSSTADDIAPQGSFVPYEVGAPPGGQTFVHADVDVKSYDLEFAKTIPLGGGGGCGCDDPCGCGDACGSSCGCPAWDVTWSGGFRFADVDWNRTYTAVDEEEFITTEAVSEMNFRGGGLRVGLEGRRYFFDNGCMSVYLKGDISLLLGDVRMTAARIADDPTTPTDVDTLNFQTFRTRQIIPVTELEAGLTGHITCNTSVTTGYLFSAWHDLGFRDEFNFPTLMETRYDDANILGFDGFFARLEVAY